MSFVILNCQVVECADIFANPVFKNPGIIYNGREMQARVFMTFSCALASLICTGASILGDPGAVSQVGRKCTTKVFKTFVQPFLPTRLTAAGCPRMRYKLSENLAIFIPIFLIIFKLDTDQMKQPRLFRFMRPEAKWNACRIDKRSDDDKIGLDRNVAIQVNFERFVWGHWGKTVLISSRQFALTGLFLWNLLPVPS